jgi:DNA polymerase (family X)
MHAFSSPSGLVQRLTLRKSCDRKSIADHLHLTADLWELLTGDEMEADRYRGAASLLRGLPEQAEERLTAETLHGLDGLDADILIYAQEFLETEDSLLLSRLREEIPPQVESMLHLPGLGAKRLHIVWKEMGITDSTGLWHAAIENRLLDQKGFGPKTQEKVIQSLAHARMNAGPFLWSDLHPVARRLEDELRKLLGPQAHFALTGAYRRGLPICEAIEIIAHPDLYREMMLHLIRTPDYEILTAGADMLKGRLRDTEIPFIFRFKGANYHLELFRSTGSALHADLIPVQEKHGYRSEREIYEEAGLHWLPPELREGKEEVKLALAKKLPRLVETGDIKGLLHAHSTASDGSDSLEKMALRCRDMGMQYLGITDHGPGHRGKAMRAEDILAQHREIDRLNQRMAPFRILKGVEAEILPDGSLGMTAAQLASFDFVIASLHPEGPLGRAEATMRLIRAIRNPYVTMLGHPSGRMLPGEAGPPVDMEAVIDACATHDVSLELNCLPCRMDLDWQWVRVAVAQGVRIAINPNAHSAGALKDYELGIPMARKGLLSAGMTVNAAGLMEMEEWLMQRRALRIR